jgi:hypothetical protein
MANLYPDTTGLPMTVWVSPRGKARHDVRVKLNVTHSNKISIADTAVVGMLPTPHVIAGQLSAANTQAVFRWGALNTDAHDLLGGAYRYGADDHALKPLPPHCLRIRTRL